MNRRQAPSVSYPLGPCVLYRRWLVFVWGLGLATVVGHFWHVGQVSIGPILLLAGAAGLVLQAWRGAPEGHLCWAGAEGWRYLAGKRPGEKDLVLPAPQVVWRGHRYLLLRLETGPRQLKWLWVERWRDPVRWDAVCRATQAR